MPDGAVVSAAAVVRDVVFADRLGFRPLTLDVHRPAASPAPVVVFVHGGGWRTGSRRVFCPGVPPERSFGLITSAGIAVAAIDYRLSGEATFPAAVDDVAAAIDWVRSDGTEHGLDPTRIVLWGESAGAHLAALAALTTGAGRQVRGVVDWYGPSDLTRLGVHLDADHPERFDDAQDTREAGLLGGSPSSLPGLARSASPALRVVAGAPPFHIAHGTADDLVPFAQSEELADALRSADVPVELLPVAGASHFWRGADDTDPLFSAAVQFVLRVTDPALSA